MQKKSWKELGYVPDSEDDEDISLEQGIDEISSDAVQIRNNHDLKRSISSGSLSSLSDIDEDVLQQLQPLDFLTSDTIPQSRSIATRNLRIRTALQKNPYSLEIEQYRQQLKRSGLKPINVVNKSQTLQQESLEDDAEFSLNDPSQQPKTPESSSPPQNRIFDSVSLSLTDASSLDEDPKRGPKRLKISPANNFDIFELPQTPVPPHHDRHTPSKSSIMSSPRVITKPISNHRSTESHMHVISISEHSESTTEQESESGSGSESPVNEFEDRVKSWGKKLQGVLPRSWVRLDLEAQKDKDAAKMKRLAINRSRKEHRNATGVARIVKSSDRPKPIQSDKWLDLDSSSPEPPEIPVIDLNRSKTLDSDPGSEMEFDHIDLMGPSRERVKGSKSRKKPSSEPHRQQRLHDFFGEEITEQSIMRGMKPKSQAKLKKITKQHHMRLKPKKYPDATSLSVLDLSDGIAEGQSIPSFLKIARRQARKSQNLGRHSPSNKVIQLRTREDTAEVNMTLNEWRKGNIKPRDIPKTTSENVKKSNLVTKIRSSMKQRNMTLANSIKDASCQLLPTDCNIPNSTSTTLVNQSKPKKNNNNKEKAHTFSRGFRTAQLEGLEATLGYHNRKSAFHTAIQNANQQYALQKITSRGVGPELLRYLVKDSSTGNKNGTKPSTNPPKNPPQIKRRLRKGVAKYLDTENELYQQPDEIVEITPLYNSVKSYHDDLSHLKDFQFNYSVDFGCLPLPNDPKSHFNQSTFIGSGQLMKAIYMNYRSLSIPNGSINISLNTISYVWSAWDESMASDLQFIFTNFEVSLQEFMVFNEPYQHIQRYNGIFIRIANELRSIINAFSCNLYFTDEIDKQIFISTIYRHHQQLLAVIRSIIDSGKTSDLMMKRDLCIVTLRLLTLQLASLTQLLAIEIFDLSDSIIESIRSVIIIIIESFSDFGYEDIESSLHKNKDLLRRENGFDKTDISLEAIVTVYQVLQHEQLSGLSFWDLYNRTIIHKIKDTNSIIQLENDWKKLFTILPLLEFNEQGKTQIGKRFQSQTDNWDLVFELMLKVIQNYNQDDEKTQSFNNYIRVLLKRCHRLIQAWGWYHCESILIKLFRFFADSRLQPLRDEDLRSSPGFLKMLDQSPSLDLESNDTAFTIFLKIVAMGLWGLSTNLSPAKFKNIIYRLLPNHNRQYLKEDDIEKMNLQALRNNHDLLSTLYWRSTPDMHSKILISIRELVHHGVSHQSACQISIDSWTNLTRYQVAHENQLTNLDEIILWIKDAINNAISHYRLARSEIQSHYHSRNYHNHDKSISLDSIEKLVQLNRSSVRKLFGDIVFALQSVLKVSQSQKQVVNILKDCGISKLLIENVLEHSKEDQLILSGVLKCYKKFLELPLVIQGQLHISQNKDESQDYGDFPMEMISLVFDTEADEVESLDFIEMPVRQFLSNCLGHESLLLDDLIQMAIDTWVKVLQLKVKRGLIKWSDVLDTSTKYSWDSFLQTNLKSKFTGYFYSSIILLDKAVFYNYSEKVMSAWFVSLVERRSKLKYQALLTSTLLNIQPQHDILHNLPFFKTDGLTYHVTIEQLRASRLSLISCLLDNMQRLYNISKFQTAPIYQKKVDFRSILRDMMMAMKQNYIELEQAGAYRGDYTDFVQHIIGFFHQHTEGILTIDKFFFEHLPLPAQDKEYVTARLKGYSTRLGDEGKIKRLIYYVWGLHENALIEEKTDALVEQFIEAINNDKNSISSSSLRVVLMEAIFPGYIQECILSPVGWILCKSALLIVSSVVHNLIYSLDSRQPDSFHLAIEMIDTIVLTIHTAVLPVLDRIELLNKSHVLDILSFCLNTIKESILISDFIKRSLGWASISQQSITFFKNFYIHCAKRLLGKDELWEMEKIPIPPIPNRYEVSRNFTANEVRNNLVKWKIEGNQYLITSPRHGDRHIRIDILNYDEAKQKFFRAVEEFFHVLDLASVSLN